MAIWKIVKKRWYVLVILLIVGGIFVMQRTKSNAATVSENSYTVKRDTLKDTLSISGKIDANEKVTLQFQSAGKLAWVGVKVGDVVKKGDSIASLDVKTLQNSFQQYLNTYSKTRSAFDQSKSDNSNTAANALTLEQRQAAQRLIDESQADLNNAVLAVEAQKLALSYAYLTSPIDGIITRADSPYAGVNITPTQAQFDIINPDTFYFSALADQTDVVKLVEGMSGDITLDAFPDGNFSGSVQSISLTPKDGETGTVYEVKMSILDHQSQYRLGMTGDVTFTLKEKPNVLLIPASYIKTENNKDYVLKSVNGKKEKVFIQTGETNETDTEVTSGLQEGDVIYD